MTIFTKIHTKSYTQYIIEHAFFLKKKCTEHVLND